MKMYHDQAISRGFLMVIIPFIMIFSIFTILLMSEYYKAYTVQANVNKDLKRISTKVTIQEVRDLYSVDRDAVVNTTDLRDKISTKIQDEIQIKQGSRIESLVTTVDLLDKEIVVTNDGYLDVMPISKLSKGRKFKVKVKGRCKVQRMDSGRVD